MDSYFTGKVGLLGPAGGTEITKNEPWWFSPKRYSAGKLSGKVFHKKKATTYGPYNKVRILDGSCLITKRNYLQSVGIPKIKDLNWHFYDHALSIEYAKKGYELMTVPILIDHESKGEQNNEFKKSEKIFANKYL